MMFFSLFGLFSCKKTGFNFELKGQVTDATFSQPLAGAKVTLEEIVPGGTSGETLHQTTVASDGSYTLIFKRRKATRYILTIEKENYFIIYKEIPFGDFSTEEPLGLTQQTTAKAWVKLIFINEAPSSDLDLFRFTKQQGKQDCSECCPTTEQSFYGTETREYICVNDGNTTYSYQYFASNPSDAGFNGMVTPAFDTVELIKYW